MGNFLITKPDIRLEPRESGKPIYFIAAEGPVVTIDLPENSICHMKNIILA
jgi:hypothetical protein